MRTLIALIFTVSMLSGTAWAMDDCNSGDVCGSSYGARACKQACRSANTLERIEKSLAEALKK